MPFITEGKRAAMETFRRNLDGQDLHLAAFPPLEVGDWCYYYYKPMVDAWRADPHWRTADSIYRNILINSDNKLATRAARELAWQVFFQLHVMPYEHQKRKENGDI